MRGSDNLKARPCRCIQARMLKQFLGPGIAMAETIRSPLFQPGNGEPLIDRTKENLFVKATWKELTKHLKWVLACQFNLNPNFKFRIITDEQILRVRLGQESYTQRAKGVRDRLDTLNNLNDLVGGFDLLIIRLGWVGHKNIALAGWLKETLGLREVELKPTWVNEEPGAYFGDGHHAWSPDVDDYIQEHFDAVDLRQQDDIDNPQAPVDRVYFGEPEDNSVGIGTMTPQGEPSLVESSIDAPGEDREDPVRSQRRRAGGYKPGRKRWQQDDDSGGGDGPGGISV